jgi:hypothetical protein
MKSIYVYNKVTRCHEYVTATEYRANCKTTYRLA